MDKKRKMKWQTDLEKYFDVYSNFLLDGYVEDLQPVGVGEDGVEYVSLPEYLERTYGVTNGQEPKCVIVYDPFECADRRFDIRSPYTETEETAEDGTTRTVRTYESVFAQHFYDILHNDALPPAMIQHEANGIGLDIARIHYAVNELYRSTSGFSAFINTLLGRDSGETGYLFIIKSVSRLLSGNSQNNGSVFLDRDELSLFSEMLKITHPTAAGTQEETRLFFESGDRARHKFFLLANKATDLPYWLYDEGTNHFIKKLTVSKPTTENKREFFREMAGEFNGGNGDFPAQFCSSFAELNDDSKDEIIKRFLAYTDDFSMQALVYYRDYVTRHGEKFTDPEKVAYSVTEFKSGEQVNPWDDDRIVREILNLGTKVKERLSGQDQAIDAVQAVMTRAAVGLDRIKNPSAPRAVLFLAGPTGTGKTEICKCLANIIFGSEDKMVRFDMSEYRQDHSDQKLFGAPPGYVGYEEGGKLTNAMKAEPFSLVLFDEIEKASSSIMDKFLQILSDGRLTDGKGETVSFRDAIIVMTSNAGISESMLSAENESKANKGDHIQSEEDKPRAVNMNVVIEDENNGVPAQQTYEDLKNYVLFNLRRYFVYELNRPELFGRIFDAIVCYNFIGRDVVSVLCDKQIKSINKAARGMFGANVECPEEVLQAVVRSCNESDIRSNGARGINKQVNTVYETGLSAFIGKYLRGVTENGVMLERSMLRGAVLRASLTGDSISSPNDIVWSLIS